MQVCMHIFVYVLGGKHRWNLLYWQWSPVWHLLSYFETFQSYLWRLEPFGFLMHVRYDQVTPARTLSISGLKSRVLKLSFLSLKMMVKSGLEFILKLTEPLQRYLLSCQANSAILGRYFCTGQQQLWRGSVNFKIKSLDHFLPSFLSKNW